MFWGGGEEFFLTMELIFVSQGEKLPVFSVIKSQRSNFGHHQPTKIVINKKCPIFARIYSRNIASNSHSQDWSWSTRSIQKAVSSISDYLIHEQKDSEIQKYKYNIVLRP